MLSAYYKIWVDAIAFIRSGKTTSHSWKLVSIISMSALQGINLATILLWIKGASGRQFKVILPIQVVNLNPINTFISIVLTFFLPFVILNYLLIFNGNRYILLSKMYSPRNGKLYLWYMALSAGILVVPYLLKWIF